MKFIYIKDEHKNEIHYYGKEKTALVTKIENLCNLEDDNLVGYHQNSIRPLNPLLLEVFITNNDKTYTILDHTEYLIKHRLYELKNRYEDTFIYINKSCLANVNLIDHFEVSFGGALIVVFKSGYQEYVSRRLIKTVKERILKNESTN